MQLVSTKSFLAKSKYYFGLVTDRLETLLINRPNDKAVVMISLERYNELIDNKEELEFWKKAGSREGWAEAIENAPDEAFQPIHELSDENLPEW